MADTARNYRWSEVTEDTPIALLNRRKVEGEHLLIARLELAKGCIVPKHSHHNEQIAVILSGKIRFFVEDDPGRDVVLGPGEVMHLPPHVAHGVEVLEDTLLFDVLSPPGPMGVDRLAQKT